MRPPESMSSLTVRVVDSFIQIESWVAVIEEAIDIVSTITDAIFDIADPQPLLE